MQRVLDWARPEQPCGHSGEAGGRYSQRTEEGNACELLQALDEDEGSGGVSENVFCQERLVLWDVYGCSLMAGGMG